MVDKNIGKKIKGFTITKKIGAGSFGQIYLCEDKSGKKFAIKMIAKSKINTPMLKNAFMSEVRIMAQIDDPNVLRLYEFMESGSNYYLILPVCNNGDLRKYMDKRGCSFFREEEGVMLLKQLSCGFQALHKANVIHRDFKLDNCFMNDDTILIADLGFAKSTNEMTCTDVGTPYYKAPEILDKEPYSNQVDLWALGVSFYELLFGEYPFGLCFNPAELRQGIRKKCGKDLPMNLKVNNISSECQDLLRRIITEDPKKRLTWAEFYAHPLFEKWGEKIDTPKTKSDLTFFGTALNIVMEAAKKKVEDRFNKAKLSHQDTAGATYYFNPDTENVDNNFEQIKDDDTIDLVILNQINKNAEQTSAFENCKSRYSHECNRCQFIGKAASKLISIANLIPSHPNISSVVISYVFLTRKLKSYLNMCYMSLEQKKDLFGQKFFDEWTKEAGYYYIVDQWSQDVNKGEALWQNHVKPTIPNYQYSVYDQQNLLPSIELESLDLNFIKQVLEVKIYDIKKLICGDPQIVQNYDLHVDILQALVYCIYATNDMDNIHFIEHHQFNWKAFYSKLEDRNSENLQRLAGL